MSNKKTILIVEDELYLSKVLQKELLSSGYNVVVAKDGEEGLKKASKKGLDLILLDIAMPKMDGITMLKHLREDKNIKTPVIILTNYGLDEYIKDATGAIVEDFLIKADHTVDEIVERIKKMLGE